MSETEPQNPTPQTEPVAEEPIAPDADPLLSAGAFIDPNGPQPPPENIPDPIEAQPITIVAPDGTPSRPPGPGSARRNPDEMAKRPSWLPDDWKIDLRVRSSGATAGMIDRYYLSPSGQKFRSKIEVTTFLQTGSKQKRKLNPEADAGASGTPASEKPKKSAKSPKSPSEKPKKSPKSPSEKPEKPKKSANGKPKKSSGKRKNPDTLKTENLASTTCS